jgi:uncharacterized protein
LTVLSGSIALVLPVRPPREEDAAIRFQPPECSSPIAVSRIEPVHHNWLVHRDLARDVSTLEIIKDEGVVRLDDIDLEIGDCTREWYTYRDHDFASPRGETRTDRSFHRGDWSVCVSTRTVLTADNHNFHLRAELDAWEGDRRAYSQNWQRTIPRDGT